METSKKRPAVVVVVVALIVVVAYIALVLDSKPTCPCSRATESSYQQ